MISVVIPALNEAATIGELVMFAMENPLTYEVIVVDDGSVDETPEIARECGARVVTSTLLGKGASIADGIREAQTDFIVVLDGDLQQLAPDLLDKLVNPLLLGESTFVKARFRREAGRVTELVAKPLLKVFFPELGHFVQPLGGIIAFKKSILENYEFESDYGVDLGLLIDMAMSGESIVEVDVGEIVHDPQSLESLAAMASQVTRVALQRAHVHGRLSGSQMMEAEERERRNIADRFLDRSVGSVEQGVVLFDMDNTLLDGRIIEAVAERASITTELSAFLDNEALEQVKRTRAIACLMRGLPIELFRDVAKDVPLNHGAIECIRVLKRLGYRVGIVSDSFQVATEIVRRRVFADFSLGHTLRFRDRIAVGTIDLCKQMIHEDGCRRHYLCKHNAMLHLSKHFQVPLSRFIAIGDGLNDRCMLEHAGLSFAFRAKDATVQYAASHSIEESLLDLLHFVPNERFPLTSVAS